MTPRRRRRDVVASIADEVSTNSGHCGIRGVGFRV